MEIDFYRSYTSTAVSTDVNLQENVMHKRILLETLIARYLPSDKDVPVLDVGCGYGAYVLALKHLGFKNVLGVDISPEQIEVGRREFGLTEIQVSDAFNYLPRKTNKFGAILIMDVIEHLETDKSIELLLLAKQSLIPGGVLVIMTPNAITPFAPYRHWDITHKRAYTTHSLTQSFRIAGLNSPVFGEALARPTNTKSLLKWFVWKFFSRPIVKLVCIACHGSDFGGIFTRNILAVAKND